MKKLLLLLTIIPPMMIVAQQTKFLTKAPNGGPGFGIGDETSLAKVFEAPCLWSELTLNVAELANVSKYDFSKLDTLEELQIQFTLCPDSSLSYRKFYRDSIATLMKNMSVFAKCPNLKYVVFCIGEQIYTDPPAASLHKRNKEFQKNVDNAWLSFGNEVSAALPGRKLYAFTWNW